MSRTEAEQWSFRSKKHNRAIYDRHMHKHLGAMVAVGVKPQDLRTYYQQLTSDGLGWSSQHQLHSLLYGAYKQAIVDGLLHDNPTLHAKPIKPKRTGREKKAFTMQEAEKFFNIAIEERWAMPFAFMMLTGLRPGEALGLQWQDLTA